MLQDAAYGTLDSGNKFLPFAGGLLGRSSRVLSRFKTAGIVRFCPADFSCGELYIHTGIDIYILVLT